MGERETTALVEALERIERAIRNIRPEPMRYAPVPEPGKRGSGRPYTHLFDGQTLRPCPPELAYE